MHPKPDAVAAAADGLTHDTAARKPMKKEPRIHAVRASSHSLPILSAPPPPPPIASLVSGAGDHADRAGESGPPHRPALSFSSPRFARCPPLAIFPCPCSG
jgi:hypothetical protein